MSLRASLRVFTLSIFLGVCFAQSTWYVGSQEEFHTINDALDAASDGDLIILRNETFSGEGNFLVDLSNKSVTISGSGSTIIDGLQNGPIFFANATDANHSIVITLLTIQNAVSTELGGAINFHGHPGLSLTIDNVAFINNKGAHAGAIAVEEGGSNSTIFILGSTFQNNNGSRGGAICVRNCTLLIDQSTFSHNKAGRGGALYTDSNTVAEISRTFFLNNTAHMSGGAIFQATSSTIYADLINIESNRAACNCTWHTGSNGGAWYLSGNNTAAWISESVISYNFATNGGAFAVSSNAALYLTNTTLDSNSVTLYGGALYVDSASVSLDSSTFSSNSADGGAVSYVILSHDFAISNSTFSNNIASDFGGAFFCQDSHIDVTDTSVINNSKEDFWCGPNCFAEGFCPSTTEVCQDEKDHTYKMIIVMVVMALMVAQLGTFTVVRLPAFTPCA